MQTADIQRDIRTFLINTFTPGRSDTFTDNDSLLGKVIDSTGVLELVAYLQDHFSIVIPDEDVTPENLNSVNTIAAYVERRLTE
jgi:acyl carrier protein